jgi:hypothetical protein
MTMMIGLTGLRNVGKTTVAEYLVSAHGFVRVHAFEGGKEAAFAYFRHCGADTETATRMIWGDLKDLPSALLPGDASPRYFLERFGRFMGQEMGVGWTLGAEVARARLTGRPIVVESLVYEAGWFRAQGGMIIRIERPGHDGPIGDQSDSVQAAIKVDAVLVNDGDVGTLCHKALAMFERSGWLGAGREGLSAPGNG